MIKGKKGPVLFEITDGEKIEKYNKKLTTIFLAKSSSHNTFSMQCKNFYKTISKF